LRGAVGDGDFWERSMLNRRSGDTAQRPMSGAEASDRDGGGAEGGGKFADYIKFDDLFGASALFTSGTAQQNKQEAAVYVKDAMERRLYGYVHGLLAHGEPIERITIGAGRPEDVHEGIDLSAKAAEQASRGKPRKKARTLGAGAPKSPVKRANNSAQAGSSGRQGCRPSDAAGHRRGSVGAGSGERIAGKYIDGSLFEREDWDADPRWEAMELVGEGGGGGGLENPGTVLGQDAVALMDQFDEQFDRDSLNRVRFQEVEVRLTPPLSHREFYTSAPLCRLRTAPDARAHVAPHPKICPRPEATFFVFLTDKMRRHTFASAPHGCRVKCVPKPCRASARPTSVGVAPLSPSSLASFAAAC